MPIQIGQAEPGCDDPMGLLVACHRRVERFLKTLSTLARQAPQGELPAEQKEAMARSLRYFREAAPHHTADEEQDLFPLLITRDTEAAAAVDRLEQDHIRAGELHRRVDAIGEQWIRDGSVSDADREAFRGACASLEQLYSEHIRIEESEVFPRASRVLDATELESVGRRMAARRGVPFPVK